MPHVVSTTWRCARGHTITMAGPPGDPPPVPVPPFVEINFPGPVPARTADSRPTCPVCFLQWIETNFPTMCIGQTVNEVPVAPAAPHLKPVP